MLNSGRYASVLGFIAGSPRILWSANQLASVTHQSPPWARSHFLSHSFSLAGQTWSEQALGMKGAWQWALRAGDPEEGDSLAESCAGFGKKQGCIGTREGAKPGGGHWSPDGEEARNGGGGWW